MNDATKKAAEGSESAVERFVMPDHEVIYLIPGDYDGEPAALWCDDAAPSDDDEESEAVKYIRADYVEWLWANCKIVNFPVGGGYPFEHTMAANKDSREFIEQEMRKHLKA